MNEDFIKPSEPIQNKPLELINNNEISIDISLNQLNASISSSASGYRTLKSWNFDGLDIEMLTTDTEDFTEMSLPTFPTSQYNRKHTDTSFASSFDDIEHDLNALAEKNRRVAEMLNENNFETEESNDERHLSSTPIDLVARMLNDKVTVVKQEEKPDDEIEGAAGLWAQVENAQCFNRFEKESQVSESAGKKLKDTTSTQPAEISYSIPTTSTLFSSQPQPSTSGIQNKTSNIPVRTVFVPSVYGYSIVEPTTTITKNPIVAKQKSTDASKTVDEIMMASEEALVYTKEDSKCNMCRRDLEKGQIVLKDCLHIFCRRCLTHALENNDKATMQCPNVNVNCEGEVRDDEIKAILTPAAYENFVKNSLIKLNLYDLAEMHESYEYVETKRGFKCNICLEEIAPGNGITLKNCIHDYCKVCFTAHINNADSCVVRCPYRNEKNEECVGIVMDSELRSFASADTYLRILNKSLAMNEADPKSYHCKTPNCKYWVILDDEFVEEFDCSLCKKKNCVKCKTVHHGLTCNDYQARIRNNVDYVRTERQVQQELNQKKIQPCPNCRIGVERVHGCPNMQCTRCGVRFIWQQI